MEKIIRFVDVLIKQHDPYYNSHSKNTAHLVSMLAIASRYPEEKLLFLEYATRLHDVGKLMIPEILLNKIGRLTGNELSTIQRHAFNGYRAIRSFSELEPVDKDEFVSRAIYQHHENWDGTGYPQGLRGEHICIEARMIRICDTFDALTTDRAYRKALTFEMAVDLLDADRGLFDPILLDIFLRQVLKAYNHGK